MADLTKAAAAAAALFTSADRLIAVKSGDAADLATAQVDLANADDTISAEVDAGGPASTLLVPPAR